LPAQRLLNLNTVGAIRLAQAVLPQMRARGDGKLLFMSDIAGRVVLPPGEAYAATKWALEALVEALDDATNTLPDDPYAEILKGGGPRAGSPAGSAPFHSKHDQPCGSFH
jgi:hypothetical protein